MAEAVGTGLPVIATEESGPPDSAMVIEARSPEAIRESPREHFGHPAPRRWHRVMPRGSRSSQPESFGMVNLPPWRGGRSSSGLGIARPRN